MSARELFVSDYPIYSVGRVGEDESEFYVAGGGGTSKTGVPNSLDVHRLRYENGDCVSVPIHHHDMETGVVMNSATHPKNHHQLAVGVGADCIALEFSEKKDNDSRKSDSKVRKRKKSKEDEQEDSSVNSGLSHSVMVLSQKKTDFSSEKYQKVVAFSCDGERVVTGGCDGVVRVWEYPSLEKLCELKGHQTEIETISCHPSKQQVVSSCRGGRGVVWDLTNHDQEHSFSWSLGQPSEDKSVKPTHRFRACCFSPLVEDGSDTYFYTISIPIDAAKKKQYQLSQIALDLTQTPISYALPGLKCYLVKWDAGPWIVDECAATGSELLSALAIDSREEYIAIGTIQGNVLIYTSALKLYTRVLAVHNVFITGLLFLPLPSTSSGNKMTKRQESSSSSENLQILKRKKQVLVTVSVDRTCNAIIVKKTSGVFKFNVLILIILLLILLAFIFTTKYYKIW